MTSNGNDSNSASAKDLARSDSTDYTYEGQLVKSLSALRDAPSVGVVGAGAVAMSCVLSIIHKDVASRILVNDIDKEKALGEVLDCQDAGFATGTKVCLAELRMLAHCDVVVITAGAKQRPNEPRTELIGRNAKILSSIISGMFPDGSPPNPKLILLLVSNPVDVLTSIAQQLTVGILPRKQVIGSGTYLDSERLRIAIGRKLGVSPQSVHAHIVGEHGDSQVAAWSSASIGSCKLSSFHKLTPHDLEAIENSVRNKAYEIIQRKGATSHGIGSAVAKICACILLNKQEVLPLSIYVPHLRTCLGWPAVLGTSGATPLQVVELDSKEKARLDESVDTLKHVLNEVDVGF